jgi:hypothetical protein
VVHPERPKAGREVVRWHGRLGDHERIGGQDLRNAGRPCPDQRPLARMPRNDDRARDRPTPGRREPAAERTVGRAVGQPGAGDRRGGDERDVVPSLGEVGRGSQPAPVAEVVEHDDASTDRRTTREDVVDGMDARPVHPWQPLHPG